MKTKKWDDAIEKMREKPTDCKVKGTQVCHAGGKEDTALLEKLSNPPDPRT